MTVSRLFDRSLISYYWLGFIYADGCICGNRLYITLSAKDRQHLEKLGTYINASLTDNIRNSGYCRNTKIVSLTKRFDQSGKDCFEIFGIVPRKTYNFVKPTLEGNMFMYWLIGLIDGDGTVDYQTNHYKDKTYSYPRIHIEMSPKIIDYVSHQLTIRGLQHGITDNKRKGTKILNIYNRYTVSTLYRYSTYLGKTVLKRKWSNLDPFFVMPDHPYYLGSP